MHCWVHIVKDETNKTDWADIIFPRRKRTKTEVDLRTVYGVRLTVGEIEERGVLLVCLETERVVLGLERRVRRKWEKKKQGKKEKTIWAGFRREHLDSQSRHASAEKRDIGRARGGLRRLRSDVTRFLFCQPMTASKQWRKEWGQYPRNPTSKANRSRCVWNRFFFFFFFFLPTATEEDKFDVCLFFLSWTKWTWSSGGTVQLLAWTKK